MEALNYIVRHSFGVGGQHEHFFNVRHVRDFHRAFGAEVQIHKFVGFRRVADNVRSFRPGRESDRVARVQGDFAVFGAYGRRTFNNIKYFFVCFVPVVAVSKVAGFAKSLCNTNA